MTEVTLEQTLTSVAMRRAFPVVAGVYMNPADIEAVFKWPSCLGPDQRQGFEHLRYGSAAVGSVDIFSDADLPPGAIVVEVLQ